MRWFILEQIQVTMAWDTIIECSSIEMFYNNRRKLQIKTFKKYSVSVRQGHHLWASNAISDGFLSFWMMDASSGLNWNIPKCINLLSVSEVGKEWLFGGLMMVHTLDLQPLHIAGSPGSLSHTCGALSTHLVRGISRMLLHALCVYPERDRRHTRKPTGQISK